MEQKELAEFS